jgi:hypothetical protein
MDRGINRVSVYGLPENRPAGTDQTAAQYKTEADKQINEQNASQELARLEQEVAAEEANQP